MGDRIIILRLDDELVGNKEASYTYTYTYNYICSIQYIVTGLIQCVMHACIITCETVQVQFHIMCTTITTNNIIVYVYSTYQVMVPLGDTVYLFFVILYSRYIIHNIHTRNTIDFCKK